MNQKSKKVTRKMIEFRHIPFEDRTDKDDSRFHFHYTRARLNKLGLQQVVSSSKKMVDREQVIPRPTQNCKYTGRDMYYSAVQGYDNFILS